MIVPNQHRQLTGALSAFAVRLAASASLPVEQLRLTPLRRQPGTPKIPPRQSRPAPLRSRQYTGAMSTTVLRDQRLTPGARVLAGLLVALAGREGYADLTRGYLAAQLGVSSRTVARQLAELRRYCYVATTHLIGDLGQTTGLRVGLLDLLLPYWEAAEEGVTDTPALESKILREEAGKVVPARPPVLGYPRYRKPRQPMGH